MCINTAIAYPVYVAPILFPKNKWLGLGPVFFGMSQAGLHGIMPRAALGEWYGPGFLSSALLHVPIGTAYIRALKRSAAVTGSDYRKGLVYAVVIFIARSRRTQHPDAQERQPLRLHRRADGPRGQQ